MNAYQRFLHSMTSGQEAWRDGSRYDLAALAEATPLERTQIESLLLARGIPDVRDVEALAALGTPAALDRLRLALDRAELGVCMAVWRHCPDLGGDPRRSARLVQALQSARFFAGLSQALDEVERWHPPELIDALLRGLLQREGEVACHFAAMLYYLHGRADEPFDIEQREFFWRFNSDSREQRVAALRELCAAIGRDPAPYLSDPDGASC
jgi:hypothetical protein